MAWKKQLVYNLGGSIRYEYVKPETGITIDITEDRKQGYAGSNKVSVLGGSYYGGYLLGTPKSFATKAQVRKFVRYAMNQLNKRKYGRKVPFLA